jgi:hypothetical protein
MPLQPLNLLNPIDEEQQAKNWRQMDAGTKTIVKTDLTLTLGLVGTPTIGTGYFTLYGPIVFYEIQILLNDGDGWTTSSIVSMPYSVLTNPATGLPLLKGQGIAFNSTVGGLGATITQLSHTVVGYLSFGGAFTNTTGADMNVTLQGWYYRN